MKILPVGTELFHVGKLTEMTKLRVAFRSFQMYVKESTILSLYGINWLVSFKVAGA
jgi:hypothetical protein